MLEVQRNTNCLARPEPGLGWAMPQPFQASLFSGYGTKLLEAHRDIYIFFDIYIHVVVYDVVQVNKNNLKEKGQEG